MGGNRKLPSGTLTLSPPGKVASRSEGAGRWMTRATIVKGPLAKVQLNPETYRRAGRLIGSNLDGLVLNGSVIPHWIEDQDRFWYDQELPGGHRFVLVNARTGGRQPAFDHEFVADAIATVTGDPVDATKLPFRRFEFGADASSIIATVGTTRYRSDGVAGVTALPSDPDTEGLLLSPDERWGLRVEDGNLVLAEIGTDGVRRLTHDGLPDAGFGIHPDAYGGSHIPRSRAGTANQPVGTSWSPNGRWVIAPFIDQRAVTAYPFIDSASPEGSLRPSLHQVRLPLVGERPASVEWYSFDLQDGSRRHLKLPTGTMLRLQADLLPIADVSWHRDEHRAYVTAWGDEMESASLFEVDVSTGAVRAVIEDVVSPRTDLNSTSYNLPNVWIGDDGDEALWFSQRDGWGHLYRYDVDSGGLKGQVTTGDWLVRDILRVDQQERVVYFTGSGREPGNPYYRYLYRASFDGGDPQLLTPEPADHHLLPARRLVYSPDGTEPHDAFSPSGAYVAYTYSTVDQPPVCAIRSTATGELITVVEEADASALFAVGWRPPKGFTVKAADGITDLWGVLYEPPDLDPAGSYPLLDAQYASPLIAVTPRNFFQAWEGAPALSQAAYAELGFVVMTIDGRGTTYRSKAFAHETFGQLNTNGLEDHVAAMERLASQRPYIDLGRVGIYGVSYGGFMTIRAMLEFPDSFHAGIATAPGAVMPAMYADYHWSAFHGRPTYADGTHERSAHAPVPDNWESLDARTQVDALRGKLMLQIGELDENVLPGQFMLFVDALIRANKDFEMLVLPGRDHFLMREGYLWRRNFDFMVRHLLGVEPPTDPLAIEMRTS